jgi:hypothetical protein
MMANLCRLAQCNKLGGYLRTRGCVGRATGTAVHNLERKSFVAEQAPHSDASSHAVAHQPSSAQASDEKFV